MLAGTPMVLLRLHGCPVGCPWCDTKETWHLTPEHKVGTLAGMLGTNRNWTEATATEIASYIAAKYSNLQWVLLTGGEPAMQPLQPLIDALYAPSTSRWRLRRAAPWTVYCAAGAIGRASRPRSTCRVAVQCCRKSCRWRTKSSS